MLGKEPESPRRRHRYEQTRAEIVAEAWRLADETGIAGLSLRELARRVGMQAPSLYTYFSSKDALFDELFAQGYRQLQEAQGEWLEEMAGLEPEEAVAHAFRVWLGFCRASVARYQLMFTRAVPGWRPAPEAYAASTMQFEEMVGGLAQIGIAGEERLRLFMALSAGIVAQQMANDPEGEEWATLATPAARMILGGTEER